jgi:two-component system nitrate/nitrite response regulator NarL
MKPQTFFDNFVYSLSNNSSAEALLRQLIQFYGSPALDSTLGDPCAEQIVVEVVIDGYHYTLTRAWGDADAAAAKSVLSPREQQIVLLVAKGLPNKTIAANLHISPCTVATHIRRIFDKLNAKSRAEMVARVLYNAS